MSERAEMTFEQVDKAMDDLDEPTYQVHRAMRANGLAWVFCWVDEHGKRRTQFPYTAEAEAWRPASLVPGTHVAVLAPIESDKGCDG